MHSYKHQCPKLFHWLQVWNHDSLQEGSSPPVSLSAQPSGPGALEVTTVSHGPGTLASVGRQVCIKGGSE